MINLLILSFLSINLICGSEWKEDEFRDDGFEDNLTDNFGGEYDSYPGAVDVWRDDRMNEYRIPTPPIAAIERPLNGGKVTYDNKSFFGQTTSRTFNLDSNASKRKNNSNLIRRKFTTADATADLMPKLDDINIALLNTTTRIADFEGAKTPQSATMYPSDSEGAKTPDSIYSGYNSSDRDAKAPRGNQGGVELKGTSDSERGSECGSENESQPWKKRRTIVKG